MKIKRIQIDKEEIKLSLFSDDIDIIHLKSKNSTRKLEIIYKFSTVEGYKVNLPNLHKHTEEIMESLPFIITSKCVKYLGINITKEVRDLSKILLNKGYYCWLLFWFLYWFMLLLPDIVLWIFQDLFLDFLSLRYSHPIWPCL